MIFASCYKCSPSPEKKKMYREKYCTTLKVTDVRYEFQAE